MLFQSTILREYIVESISDALNTWESLLGTKIMSGLILVLQQVFMKVF